MKKRKKMFALALLRSRKDVSVVEIVLDAYTGIQKIKTVMAEITAVGIILTTILAKEAAVLVGKVK